MGGDSICHHGEYCCNESCGICAPNGGHCTQQICETTEAPKDSPSPTMKPKPCGDNQCDEDEFCCNESCGICSPIGGHCIEKFCGTTTDEPTKHLTIDPTMQQTPSPTTYLRTPKPTMKPTEDENGSGWGTSKPT